MPNTTVYTNNQYYQDIATAIRNKNGQSTLYKPSEMAGAINALVTSGQSITLQVKTVSPTTSQQIVTADTGYTGLSQVTISAIQTQSKTVTTNGTVTPDSGKFLSSVIVNVPVGASINNQNKTVTPTESQQSITADSGYTGLDTVIVNAIPSTYVGSGIPSRTSSNLTTSGGTVTVPAGYYATQATKSVVTGSAGTPTATKGTVSSNSITVTPSVTNTTGYITGGTKTGTAVSVSASELVSGKKEITENGDNIDVTNYATVKVNVPTGGATPSLQSKTVTPTESSQLIGPDSGYDGLSDVTVGAISSTYVGSGITRNPARTVNGRTVTIPGPAYYTGNVSTQVSALTLPTSVATTSSGTSKLTITPTTANRYINIPTGYNETASYYTISGDADLIAGNIKSGVQIFGVTGTYTGEAITLNLQAKTGINPSTSSQTISADSGYDGLSSVQINAMPTMTLPTSAASAATSGFTSKATISRSTSDQYINIPTGYNSAGGYYKINAVANGSVTAPSSISGTTATVSTGTNTLTLTKTVSVTPNVTTAGYISSGTTGNSTVTLTANVTTKAATTITPSTSNQTIAAGTYLTGTQTISGDTDLIASNIISTANIFGVQGSVVINKYYTGNTTPSSSLGSNGDIYFQS